VPVAVESSTLSTPTPLLDASMPILQLSKRMPWKVAVFNVSPILIAVATPICVLVSSPRRAEVGYRR
jgi:hypothetical protein